MNKLLITIGSLLFVSLAYAAFSTPQIVLDIQSNKKTLECEFTDGWRIVPADKLIGLDDMNNRWLFSNGSAAMRNCEIYENKSTKPLTF